MIFVGKSKWSPDFVVVKQSPFRNEEKAGWKSIVGNQREVHGEAKWFGAETIIKGEAFWQTKMS